MSNLNVLISGAGIAGPILAYWLTQSSGVQCTVVERAPQLRVAGQQIDVRGAGAEIVKRMGLDSAVRSRTTGEKGMEFINTNGVARAKFPVDMDGGRSFTSDLEILRGDLAEVFYDASKDTARYIFDDHITGINEDASGITVEFANARATRYDLVVAADGMRSKTRKLVFGPDQASTYRSLNQYTAFFTTPAMDPEQTWAQWYNAPGGRTILTRPIKKSKTYSSCLSIMGQACSGYEKMDISSQKDLMQRLFTGAGWEADTVVKGMRECDDFYMQEIAQVKLPRWSKGRVALLGDAGYCPSPISGMGTTLAIVGAYVLAGEILQHRDDIPAAFDEYEKKMRPLVEGAQSLPPGAPALANPQSAWGIWILYTILSFAAWSGLAKFMSGLAGPDAASRFTLPEYDFDSKAAA